MSLSDFISNNSKEIAGSRAKNRLTIQISYAIQLIIEFYTTDFIILMDYIEDVSIICDPHNPSTIHLYQVKTKSSDRQYTLSTVIKDKWFQKLYSNAIKYGEFVGSASIVCNTDVVDSNREVFPNSRTSLNEEAIQSNIKKIREAIAKDQSINESEVDLSKYFFVRSTLSTNGHKDEVEHQFQEFLFKQNNDLQVATVKSIYSLIYDELDRKYNKEINEDCTDINEIFDEKGLYGNHIKDIIKCGLAIQIPNPDQLFRDFNVLSVSDQRQYSKAHTRIKIDMYSDMESFIIAKKYIFKSIDSANKDGIDNMTDLLDTVYQNCLESDKVSVAYSNEFYLKMLIMILICKYRCGDENV